MQNRQWHLQQPAGKTSNAEVWQDLPPQDINGLKSLRNQAGVGWGHRCPTSRLESKTRVGATAIHCHANPSAPEAGERGPKLIQRACPPMSIWTLNNPNHQQVLRERRELKRLCRARPPCPPHPGAEGGGTCKAHRAPLWATSVGTKRSSTVSLLSTPHAEQSLLCSAHTMRILRTSRLLGAFNCISSLEESHRRGCTLGSDSSQHTL